MARADGAGDGVRAGDHSGASDARLTELLRADTATAYAALLELRARHRSAVLAYARLCTAGESAARQLAAQAFTLAARETARGVDPGGPWRHRLLQLTARSAAAWARDERSAGLDPSVLLLLTTGAPEGPVPPLLAAFDTLPARAQGLVWYALVEAEPESRTADYLGLTRTDVVYGTEGALHALAQACLRLRLAASDDPRCTDFRRLIEESVRPDTPRASTDLHTHMAHCPHCTTAYEEQCALRDAPRATLAEGLLPWGGVGYVAAVPGGGRDDGDEEPGFGDGPGEPGAAVDADGTGRGFGGSGPGRRAGGRRAGGDPGAGRGSRAVGAGQGSRGMRAGHGSGAVGPGRRAVSRGPLGIRARPRRLVLASAALGVALAPLLLFLVSQGGDSASDTGGTALPDPPQVTVTTTVSPSSGPSPSPSPSLSATSGPPSPSPSVSKSPPPPRRTSPPSFRAPGGSYAQVVNLSTARCLDVSGDFDNGTDVVAAPCTSAASQRWSVDTGRGVVRSAADPDFCLDSRGDVDKGLGIWSCDSVEGDNGDNLRFTVDPDGVIRPAIAIATAVTPGGGGGLTLEPLTGGAEQRWRAGAS
ncbi:ricin-type beta-trefoil lectin domain protein [Streptomyces griseorubiginosus]|uniref:ricin-type beta-trefoil lectin domain protein n=1 Tax=Streptomyces griseorubiginosus TaxID=67304 RepID=UPI0036C36E8E